MTHGRCSPYDHLLSKCEAKLLAPFMKNNTTFRLFGGKDGVGLDTCFCFLFNHETYVTYKYPEKSNQSNFPVTDSVASLIKLHLLFVTVVFFSYCVAETPESIPGILGVRWEHILSESTVYTRCPFHLPLCFGSVEIKQITWTDPTRV